jgi:hypothetical protein
MRPIPSSPRGAWTFLFAAASALRVWTPATPAENRTVIRITVVETHDRLPPDELRGIEMRHEIVVTLSGKNEVHEA